VTRSEGKDSDSSNSRKTLFLRSSGEPLGFFSLSFPPSVVVVYFIGTMKSNYAFELLVFFSVTFYIVTINLCLYIGLLQFCGVYLHFFFSLF